MTWWTKFPERKFCAVAGWDVGMVGGAGSQDDDTLEGGKGNDRLWDGGGADRFVLGQESETNTIHDVEDGQDTLVLKSSLKFTDLDIKQRGGDTTIRGPSDRFLIVVKDVDASLLNADDFNFIAGAADTPFVRCARPSDRDGSPASHISGRVWSLWARTDGRCIIL